MKTIFAELELGKENFRFTMEFEERLRGILFLGKKGMGKTQALVSIALQDAAAGLPVFFIDCGGEGVREISRRLPSSRLSDLVQYQPQKGEKIPPGFIFRNLSSSSVVLIDIAEERIGREEAALWGEQFLLLIYDRALSRDSEQGPIESSVFIDSFSTLGVKPLLRFIREAPSLGIALSLADNTLSGFTSEVVELLRSTHHTLGLFQLDPKDAQIFEEVMSHSVLTHLAPGVFSTNFPTVTGDSANTVRAMTAERLGFFERPEPAGLMRQETLQMPEIPEETLASLLEVVGV